MPRSFAEDTMGDKLVRFVIGAFLGGVTGCSFVYYGTPGTEAGGIRTIAIFSAVIGVLAVLTSAASQKSSLRNA